MNTNDDKREMPTLEVRDGIAYWSPTEEQVEWIVGWRYGWLDMVIEQDGQTGVYDRRMWAQDPAADNYLCRFGIPDGGWWDYLIAEWPDDIRMTESGECEVRVSCDPDEWRVAASIEDAINRIYSWGGPDPDPTAVILAAATHTDANIREINCNPETGRWLVPIPLPDAPPT